MKGKKRRVGDGTGRGSRPTRVCEGGGGGQTRAETGLRSCHIAFNLTGEQLLNAALF